MSSSYPVWINDSLLDPQWVREKTDLPCVSCSVRDMSNQGRKGETARDGATLQLTVTLDDKDNDGTRSMSLIMKQIHSGGLQLSQQLGLAREALFYRDFRDELPADILPNIYYAHGNQDDGSKVVIMEDLESFAVDSGVFFGPGNPNNWSRDLKELSTRGGNIPAEQVTEASFRSIAKIHAHFWKESKRLLTDDRKWLRGQDWVQGKGRDTWEASQNLIRNIWNTADLSCIQWDPLLKRTAAKAVQNISWDAQVQRLNVDTPWTLVHGDFWPGNIMWLVDDKSVRLLDWEMCGIGSGPQDLGQYILSNMEPAVRQVHERRLVEAYYDELKSEGIDVSWEYCWAEYRIGGLERWLWFLVYFLGQPQMTGWAQFFHDQMASFMHDHQLTEDDVTQVRP